MASSLLLISADAASGQQIETDGLHNHCLEAPVTASSSTSGPDGGFSSTMAVDGNLSTRWAAEVRDAADLPQWLQVDFREPTTIDAVVIVQVNMPELYSNADAIVLSFSDGEDVELSLADTPAPQIVRFEPRTTTHLRLMFTSVHGFRHYVGLRQVMAFGDPEHRVTAPSPPPPIPEPVAPVYETLKDLHLQTTLVQDGRSHIVIVAPETGIHDISASALQRAIEEITGVTVPVVDDGDAAAAIPIASNLIALGNRSDNRLISDLYDRMFTMLDLKYPGRGGHVVRTLHNPFGNGHNVIFVGGSDESGVRSGAQLLVERLRQAADVEDSLQLGWMAEIALGDGLEVPENLEDVRIWEASRNYGDQGTFGWTSISKRMALYYMTGEEHHAREFLRLAFPDEQALAELREHDAGAMENEPDPLAGAYHYNAHMLIVLWDLIEESPVFTDSERLQVTNAFARQLEHRAADFTRVYYATQPRISSGDRHGDWEAVCHYVLGRYFQRDYPAPVWQRCIDAAKTYMASLHNPEGTCVTNDHLFWYSTLIAPSLVWAILTDDQEAMTGGAIDKLLLGQDVLVTGRSPDWALNTASLAFLNQAAYLTGDGRWLDYRDRLGLDTESFRLGQSFWPGPALQPTPPEDLIDRWTIYRPNPPVWRGRDTPVPFDDSFMYGSFRSEPGGGGDYVLLKDWNMASRNPYHTFALLELRIAGCTLLSGYHNQVHTSAGGLVEPKVAMNAALRHTDVLGQTAVAVAEVPEAPFCEWRRTLLQRVGRYALVIDEMQFDASSDHMRARIDWETIGLPEIVDHGLVTLTGEVAPPSEALRVSALQSEWTVSPGHTDALEDRPAADAILFSPPEPGAWIETRFELADSIDGELHIELHNYRDRGVVRLLIDGEPVGTVDHYSPSYARSSMPMGEVTLPAGEHSLRLEVIDKHPDSEGLLVHLIGMIVRPLDAEVSQSEYRLCSADPLPIRSRGRVLHMDWSGEVSSGETAHLFHLLTPALSDAIGATAGRLLPNAVALALPEPAVAFSGEAFGSSAAVSVLATDHLHGRELVTAAVRPGEHVLLQASAPIDVDWSFFEAELHVVAEAETMLRLSVANPDGVELQGQPIALEPADDGLLSVELPAGRHVLTGLSPAPEVMAILGETLAGRLERALNARREDSRAAPTANQRDVAQIAATFSGSAAGSVTAIEVIPRGDETLIAVAAGSTVTVLDTSGRQVRLLEADAEIRVMRWWAEPELLLVGCTDEQVIAWGVDGERRWVFVSEMDDELAASGKSWWFKSAGHEGIYGLHTGVFLEGESQCFVGSASTLEILDHHGELMHRMPMYWGDVRQFTLIDDPAGGQSLLASRWTNGNDNLAIVSNRTLDPSPRGFHGVPEGHTHIGGWRATNRVRTIYADLSGDGVLEVVSALNGVWNRVGVWSAGGEPLYNAHLGPGFSGLGQNIPDMDVADIDGNGRKEIVLAKTEGLIMALDHQCRLLWTIEMPTAPKVLRCVAPPGEAAAQTVVGCADGTVLMLDAAGQTMAAGSVTGTPTVAIRGQIDGANVVLIGTDAGAVVAMTAQ